MTKSKCLKRLRFSHERMSSGSLFQSSGAETANSLESIGVKDKANRIQNDRRR